MQVQYTTYASLHPNTKKAVVTEQEDAHVFIARTSGNHFLGSAVATHRYLNPYDRVIQVTFDMSRLDSTEACEMRQKIRAKLRHLHRKIEFVYV